MTRAAIAFVIAVALQGCCMCSPDSLSLDKKWDPLTTMQKSDERPSGVYWTRYPTTYTKDLCEFLNRADWDQGGILTHETTHAVRQKAYPGGWQAYEQRCASDVDFLVNEELVAYSAQIAYVVKHSGKVDPEYMANFMTTYYVVNGKALFDHDWVVNWVNGEVAKAKAGK